jgi:MFS family permease
MMSKENSNYRWFVVAVFFFFMLLHQTDKLMIGSLQVPIMEEFGINNTKWGQINSVALLVATFLYPLWGYLYDRYARAKLLALASFIWGATTWMNAIVRTFGGFLITRASTGIDDSSYPGLYSLIADYFGPNLRGKIYGILQLAQPIGYLLGMILALMVAPNIGGWRSVFYITGSLGLVIAALIFFGVKEMPRGQAEPEFENIAEMQTFRFSWAEAKEIFKKKTMWFVFLQGFAGVFPWNVITFFFFAYLEKERGYDANGILMTMAPVILILAAGYFIHHAHRSEESILYLDVPDRRVHANFVGECGRHRVRYYRP